jgi:ATP-dependent DNA helicase RecG
MLDLKILAARESEQVEWKENVADTDDVVETLAAFANDWQNLGGGYVVCGAAEERDGHGFPRLALVGLTAADLRRIEGTVLAACRSHVDPDIAPLVFQLPAEDAARRVLVFQIAASRHQAHQFRRRGGKQVYPIRVSSHTIEARNGLLLQLLANKGSIEDWDRRAAARATTKDLDLLAVRDVLLEMDLTPPGDTAIEEYLSEDKPLSAMVPSLCVKEPLTGVTRPRNFALLLFGKRVQEHIPGAYTVFSVYPGVDRSGAHAVRHELTGHLLQQIRRLMELLDAQAHTIFDKTDLEHPNAWKYPQRALREALVNALAHRDYSLSGPTRITVFADRVEFSSPGSLPLGIGREEFMAGRAPAKWRNQSLAWFMNRMQLGQAEGQGIPTILREMRSEGNPPPRFEINEARVDCILPAHPRWARPAIERIVNGAAFRLTGLRLQDPASFAEAFTADEQSSHDNALAPGLITTIFGTNLGPADQGLGLQLVQGRVARTLGGVRVLFDGIEAPLLFVRGDQINCVVPYAMTGRAQANIEVEFNGVLSNRITQRINDTAPGIFNLGSGQAAALNQNNTVNGIANPADRGQVAVLYMTGEGALTPPGVDGEVTQTIKRPIAPVQLRLGGVEVPNVQFVGAAPGLVQGVLQINFVIPENAPTGGNVPLTVTIGGANSQAGMTMAIR